MAEVSRRMMLLANARRTLELKMDAWEATWVKIPPPMLPAELELAVRAESEAISAWQGYIGELARFNMDKP